MQWLTALDCHTIGKVIRRVITAEEVRYDNCGPLFVPLVKNKRQLYDDIVPTTKYQKHRNHWYFTHDITASLSKTGLSCIITETLPAFIGSAIRLKLFIKERSAPIAFISTWSSGIEGSRKDAAGFTDGMMEDGKRFTFVLGTEIIADDPFDKVKSLLNFMQQKETETVEKSANAVKLSKTTRNEERTSRCVWTQRKAESSQSTNRLMRLDAVCSSACMTSNLGNRYVS
jgi:hypothetical protein